MPNSIFPILSGNAPKNPMEQMVQMFNQFRSQFQGDPQQQVQNLLNSGRMSQQQFNNLREQALQFQKMLSGFHNN